MIKEIKRREGLHWKAHMYDETRPPKIYKNDVKKSLILQISFAVYFSFESEWLITKQGLLVSGLMTCTCVCHLFYKTKVNQTFKLSFRFE